MVFIRRGKLKDIETSPPTPFQDGEGAREGEGFYLELVFFGYK